MTIQKQHTSFSSTNTVEPQGWLSTWFFDLKLSWLITSLIVVVPFLLNGTGLPAMLGLIGASLVGLPLICIFLISSKMRHAKSLKRISVIILICVSTLFFVFKVDKGIPDRAGEVITAIESFHQTEGTYPVSLSSLAPKYLATLPSMKPTLIQPDISYQLNDGKPYLAIPSAIGDQFSKYEYDFEAKMWKHHD